MSIQIIKSAAAITCLAAMSAAAASSVSVYGVIDTGFGVSKGKGQAAKVQGQRRQPVGFKRTRGPRGRQLR